MAQQKPGGGRSVAGTRPDKSLMAKLQAAALLLAGLPS